MNTLISTTLILTGLLIALPSPGADQPRDRQSSSGMDFPDESSTASDDYFNWDLSNGIHSVIVGRNRITPQDIDDAVHYSDLSLDVQRHEAMKMKQWNDALEKQYQQRKKRARPDALRMLIQTQLLRENEIIKRMMQRSTDAVNRRFEMIMRYFNGVQAYEAAYGVGRAEKLRTFLSDQESLMLLFYYLRQTLDPPSFDDIQRYYEEHADDFMYTERVKFRYIVIKSSHYKTIGEARERATAIFNKLEDFVFDNKPVDDDDLPAMKKYHAALIDLFDKTARSVSEDDASRARGGLASDSKDGYVAWEDISGLPWKFVEYLKRLPPYEIGDNFVEIKSADKTLFFIPCVEAVQPRERKPLDVVRDEIERILNNKALQKKERELFRKEMHNIPVRINGKKVFVNDLVPEQ